MPIVLHFLTPFGAYLVTGFRAIPSPRDAAVMSFKVYLAGGSAATLVTDGEADKVTELLKLFQRKIEEGLGEHPIDLRENELLKKHYA